jgi:hypothetical protein
MTILQISFLIIPILLAFGGEFILNQAPLVKKLRSLKEPLGKSKFSKKLRDENFDVATICALPFVTQYYYSSEKINLEKNDKISFGQVFSLVSFYEKELSKIIKELRYYSIVIGLLTIGGYLFTMGSPETSKELGKLELILKALPVFEIMLFLILIFRMYIEYSKLKSILE